MKTQRICAASVVLLFLAANAETATSAPIYHVTDLGILGPGYVSSEAYGLNDEGQVVGYSISSTSGVIHAFLYSNGTMHDLGTLGGTVSHAYGINDSGQIVGDATAISNGPPLAFLYQNGTMTSIGTLGGTQSGAGAINSSGQITGASFTGGNAATHGFLYNGTMHDLGSLGGGGAGNGFSNTDAINNLGQIVGQSNTSGGPNHAALYSGGQWTDLGSLGGNLSVAFGINDSGEVVGWSYTTNNAATLAFLYDGGTMSSLGTLGGGFSYATGINDSGQIVGYSDTDNGGGIPHAFLDTSGTMLDLNQLVDSSGAGWTLQYAEAINANGWIVGYGVDPSGREDAFLLTPYPGWSGAADATWVNSANWYGSVPGATNGTTNTDTAIFNQNAANSPLVIDAGRNLQNITFDTVNVNSLTIGTTSGPALLLTAGGTIQTTSTVVNPQTVNAPLVLEGNYTFTSGAISSSATLTFAGEIAPAASSGTTTLTLNGSNRGANAITGALADNGSGKLAVAVGGTAVWVYSGTAKTYSGGTTIAAGATLELSGSVSQLSQSQNISNAGSLVVAGSDNQYVGTITGAGNTVVNTGSSLTAYQVVQNSLTIHGSADVQNTVTLLPSGSGSTTNPTGPNDINFSSTLGSLSIDNDGGPLGFRKYYGTLDIGNNGLVIAYGSGPDPYVQIDDMIRSGYSGGTWNGTGITSSLAHAAVVLGSPTPALNIGLVDFTPGAGNYSDATYIVFEGQTVTTNAILVRLTYMDDLVLAGDTSQNDATSDALLFAANYGTGTTWGVGDLTHDGVINSSDALLFAANYVVGLPSLDGTSGGDAALGSAAAAVPEPSSVALAALGALGLGLLARRGRKR